MMSLMLKIINKFRGIALDIYFIFNKKILFKDKYGLVYYLYKNTRPKDTFNVGVRTDDTTVLYTIEKILSLANDKNDECIQCIDVGSYVGVITLMMSKTLQNNKKKWKVHCFEPFQETFTRLKKNVSLDAFSHNIVLNNLAVSDKPGLKSLKFYPESPGKNHMENINLNNENNNREEIVKVTTLRNYMSEKNIKHIKICKIDTEGSDKLIIKGLYEYLNKKSVGYFIFEYENEKSYRDIENILSAKGYTIYFMVRNENFLVNSLENYPKNSKSLLNLIAVSQDEKVNFIKQFNLSE